MQAAAPPGRAGVTEEATPSTRAPSSENLGHGDGELCLVEGGVGATGGQQLVVGTALDDLSSLHHQDQVGVADRREAVRNDEGRPGRRHHLVVGRLRFAVSDVVPDGAFEQPGILQHHTDLAPEVGPPHLGDVDTIHPS